MTSKQVILWNLSFFCVLQASRKTIAYLTGVAENSHSEVEVEMKMLRKQLENEQSRARMLEHKLTQVQVGLVWSV